MDIRTRYGILIVALAGLARADRLAGQQPDSLPAGVTPAMVAQGKKLFTGDALCFSCHGPEGRGLVGPDLTDSVWLFGNGTFEEIVARILEGVPANKSKNGVVMPPKGGSKIKDDQVRAVAAYVWSLSRQAGKK
ncbi:MAG TPA: c-type cytochrome [Gemmatimonadales bacterium]